ncbi:peptidoglycan-binding domain-containing protein [Streptomyces inhibens]|uniref:peptidoglycan-binding domain-containing protein n=1 Tax=Streptomyces inhibens TaxID=2293571 RepID=UPI001EE76D30|nr:peptidoglycan-binding domain-containing protein [Streptomyces inhibens]UKY52819.1 peptidoglycan-binding protein [Streptomyces inhibens]
MLTLRRTTTTVSAMAAGLLLAMAPALAHAVTPAAAHTAVSPARVVAHCGYYDGDATTGFGDTGYRVREIQCLINHWRGGTPLEVDGDFGPRTESWVARFQDVKGLLVDGVVGPLTWAALRGA